MTDTETGRPVAPVDRDPELLGCAPAPWITHERLDDEVMAIDLETGAYFALDDAAADVWTLLVAGCAPATIVDTMAARYGVGAETARADLTRFLGELARERLVVPADATDVASDGPTGAASLPPLDQSRAYAAPTVEKYDDLEELLRLDPVHEVDDVGWPVPRRD